MRDRRPPEHEEPLELDLPPEEARRFGLARRALDQPAAPAARRRDEGPTDRDLADARHLAGYGDPPSFFGAMLYALNLWPKRRALSRMLRETIQKRDRAIAAADASYVELGRRLHARATEANLDALRTQVAAVDHAVMRNEQVLREKRSKRDRGVSEKRVLDAQRRLAEAALDRGLDAVDREGTGRVIQAVRDANQLTREARLRELGLDMYDPGGVRRGAVLLSIVLVFLAVAAFMALRG